MMNTINVIAAFVLIVWACWCGFSRSVNDGIVGKAVYASIAILSLAIIVRESTLWTYQALVVCFALLGIRHYYLRYLRKHVFKRATT
jgi:TRAP-type C4-dicarboxylate transport system permease small subunit